MIGMRKEIQDMDTLITKEVLVDIWKVLKGHMSTPIGKFLTYYSDCTIGILRSDITGLDKSLTIHLLSNII
jgi:hypothetical protein